MMDRHTLWRKGSRVLALVLAGAMVVSLGADLSTATEAYAAESGQIQYKDEEHHHTAECYEQQVTKELVCDQEETEATEGHTHSEEDGCYDEDGNLTCDLEESEPTEGHTHTDECYETVTKDVLICGEKEHTHTDDCVIENDENVSTHIANADYDKQWTKAAKAALDLDQDNEETKAQTLADLVSSQAGYTAQILDADADDEDAKALYSLYSNWYTDGKNSTKDWNTTFVIWALDQAGFDTEKELDATSTALPIRSDLAGWVRALKAKEEATADADNALSLYMNTAEDGLSITAGDILFLDLDQDGSADRAGIALSTDTDEDNGVTNEVAVIIADLDQDTLADLDETNDALDSDNSDADVAAGIALPADDYDGDRDDEEAVQTYLESYITGIIPVSLYEQQVEAIENGDGNNKTNEHPVWMVDENTTAVSIGTVTTTGTVTITNVGKASYDAQKHLYSSNLKVGFVLDTSKVKANGNLYYYEYPDGVIIPEGLLNKENDLNDDSGDKAGTYQFVKVDGKYRLLITLDDSYVEKAGETITGHVQFSGQINGDKGDKDGKIEITGGDGSSLVINPDEITYPEGETNYYDITSSKSGSYSAKDGTLTYTVYVSSFKGTPGTISYKDTITATGMTLGTPTVTVKKQLINRYTQENGNKYDSFDYPIDRGTVTPTNLSTSGNDISMTLPKIDKAVAAKDDNGNDCEQYTRYVITYTYNVSDLASETPSAKNTVNVSSKDSKVEIKSKSDCTVDIVNKHSMTKQGWHDAQNNRIMWTITVNSNNVDITDATLSDKMLGELSSGTSVTFSPNTGYEIEKDSNGKITSIKFTAVDGGKNTNKYTITYYTDVNAEWTDQKITNDATFKPESGEGIDGSATVTVSGGGVAKAVDKADISSDGKTATITWTVTLTIPDSGLPNGTVIKDDMNQDQYGNIGESQHMTRTQVIAWANNIYWTDDSGNKVGTGDAGFKSNEDLLIQFVASDGNTYTFDQIDKNSGGVFDNLTYTVYTITLKDDLTVPTGAKKLVFNYSTTADLTDTEIGNNAYKNTVQVDEKKADAEYQYRKGGLIKTDENNISDETTKYNSTGELTWKIKASLANTSTKLVITDTLPVGVDLESISYSNSDFTIDGETISWDNNYYKVTGTYKSNSDGTKTVNFTFTFVDAQLSAGQKLAASDYTFTIKCKVDKEGLTDYETGKTYTFRNQASATDDSGSLGSAEQTQDWSEKKTSETTKTVDKSGKWDNQNRRAKYSIVLNPKGLDILEDAELLTFKDVLTYCDIVYGAPQGQYDSDGVKYSLNMYLLPNTVKLYKAVTESDGTLTKGDEVTSWSWSVETADNVSYNNMTERWDGGKFHSSTITGKNIPDSTPLILEYEYQVETNIPEGYHSTDSTLSIYNTAELSGTTYKDTHNPTDWKWEKNESSGQVTTEKSYILYKVTQNNFGKRLPGAEFKLQHYADGAYVDDTGVTYTSDDDGKITIKWSDNKYQYNTLYRVVETKAPSGYDLPVDPEAEALYFYFSDKSATSSLPTELPSGTIDLTTRSYTAYVENTSKETEITVHKRWLDPQGGDTSNPRANKISFDLYRVGSEIDPTKAGTATLTGTIKSQNEWGALWKTINESDTSYPAGTKVEFTITKTNMYQQDPDIKVGDVTLQAVENVISDGSEAAGWKFEKTYKYSFELAVGTNTLVGYIGTTHDYYSMTDISYTVPASTEKKKVGSYEITAGDGGGWSKTISGLSAYGKEGDKTYYYYYSVGEISVDGYTTSYDNNGGISTGTITIINKDNGEYKLPETGGSGTLPYTLGGSAALISSMFAGCSMRRRRRDERRCD